MRGSSGRPLPASAATAVKIVIAGGVGAGKTTFVTATSEIEPARTEELMTQAGIGTDVGPAMADGKSTTTVVFDFGRLTLDDELVLYMFGAPGQERFWYLWDHLFRGTLGAVVLVDVRHLDASFASLDRLDARGVPYIVAVNRFDGAQHYPLEQIRAALQLPHTVPLMECDARDPQSGYAVLVRLVTHVVTMHALESTA